MKLLAVFLLGLCGSLSAQKQVDNPEKPNNAPYELVFVEDLRFGGGEDDDDVYLWPNSNSNVSADSRGHMFVSDISAQRVLEFDIEGTFVREVASEGEGPGEFRGMPFFQLLSDDRAKATDMVMMSVPRFYTFDKDLKFADQIIPTFSGAVPGSAFFSPDGTRISGTTFRLDAANGKLVLGVGVFDAEVALMRQLTEYAMPMPDFSKMNDPAMWRKNFQHQIAYAFDGAATVAFDTKGRIYIGDQQNYRIGRWDHELSDEELVITRDYRPIPYQKADLDGLVDNVLDQVLQSPMPQLQSIFNESFVKSVVASTEVPPAKRPINGLLVTDAGDILAIHDIRLGSGEQLVDVFSPDGTYLNQVTLGGSAFFNVFMGLPRMSFRNGKAYSLQPGDNGDSQVVRYRLERKKG